jgi:hypothetical protein
MGKMEESTEENPHSYSPALCRVKSEMTCLKDFPQWVQLMFVIEFSGPK